MSPRTMIIMHTPIVAFHFILLLLLVVHATANTTNVESKQEKKCYDITTNPSSRDVINLKAKWSDRWNVRQGEVSHYLVDYSGNVVVASNQSTGRLCFDEKQCHFLFLSGNGFYNIAAAAAATTTTTDSTTTDDDVAMIIAEGEVFYDSPKLLQIGSTSNCNHYCGVDRYQLTFVVKADESPPTLYDRNNNVVEDGLFHKESSSNNSNTAEEEEEEESSIVIRTMCIQPSECYKLAGSALYVVSDSNGTTVEEGSTYYGYKTFGDKNNCRYHDRCEKEKPLLTDSPRGQAILLPITSISGTESLRNFDSPQYMAACWLIYDSALQLDAVSDYNILQRYILAVLYYSLKGQEWYRNYDFLTAKHECSWNRYFYNPVLDAFNIGDEDNNNGDGVHCDASGYVSGLLLDWNNLDGTLPFELTFLIHAEYLSFANNAISGPIPSQIGTMKHLRYFDVGSNALIGSIPESLGGITALSDVRILRNMITGTLPTIFNGDLEFFDLSENLLTGTIPEQIRQWTSLIRLSLFVNHFSGTIPKGIENSTLLRRLELEHNNLEGTIPTNLFTLPNLFRAALQDNALTGTIPKHVAEEGDLLILSLEDNYLTGTIPPELSSLPRLKTLELSNNNLSGVFPQSFANSTSLYGLYIQRNNITGLIPFETCIQAHVEADCDTPQKVICPCCATCHGIFTTYHDDGMECSSGELTIKADNLEPGDSAAFYLYSSFYSAIYFNEFATAVNGTHVSTTCVAMSGCFYISAYNPVGKPMPMELLINGNVVLQENITWYNSFFDFGWSSNGLMQQSTCEDFLLCNAVIEANTTKRELIDKLTRITGAEVFDDVSSSHYQAACRFVTFLEDKDDDDYKYMELIQHFFLSLLYFGTGGEQWVNSTFWATNTPFCNWYGVGCNQYGVVTSISLSSNNLLGSIPTEISELRGLEHVWLNDNSLYGTLPSEIGVKMMNLKKLNLTKNNIWGSIPSQFTLLREMKEIEISHNQLSGSIPEHIGMMSNVEVFKFFQNTLSGELPESFYGLTALEVLSLGSNLMYGDASAVKSFVYLETLDLSGNFFSGTVPLGSYQRNLRVLHLSGNRFRGSIPTTIEEVRALEELFLYNNQLTGSLPSQLGNLKNLVHVSVSYNGIRGSLPSEIGRLSNLALLHLHNNEIEGTGDFFEYSIEDYVTDCGNTFTAPARVECTSCTSCCNVDGDCLRREITWPGKAIENAVLPSGAIVFLSTVAFCVVLAGVLFTCQFVSKSEDVVFCTKFQQKSVYKLLLTNSQSAKLLVVCTIVLQATLLYIFLAASDFTTTRNDWQFSTSCPIDGVHCEDKRHVTVLAWFAFGCIVVCFLFKDFYEGSKMMHGSFRLNSLKGSVAGFTVVFITLATVETSILYLYSTGISNTDILKDAVILMFLNEIDEQLYVLLEIMCPFWLDKRNEQISQYLQTRILLSSAREKARTDEENQNSAESDPNNDVCEEMDIVASTMCEIERVEEERPSFKTRVSNDGQEAMDVGGEDCVQELGDQEDKYSKHDHEIGFNKAEIRALKNHVEQVLMDMAELRNDNTKLSNTVDKLQNDNTKLQDDNARLHDDNAELRKEMFEMKKLLQAHGNKVSSGVK